MSNELAIETLARDGESRSMEELRLVMRGQCTTYGTCDAHDGICEADTISCT